MIFLPLGSPVDLTLIIDITQDEPDWFWFACALANTFGEAGREYFHAKSQFHPNYTLQDANHKYDHALQAGYRAITMGTFFELVNRRNDFLL